MSRILLLSVGALLAAAAAAQTPALRKGISVRMPVTINAVAMPDADLPDSLVVAVTSRGAVFLGVTAVTPAQLSGKLKAELQGRPGKRVYLKGDARAPYSTMAKVMDALRTAGVNAPVLLTAQHDSTGNAYAPPKGLEVLLSPPAPGTAQSVVLKTGHAPVLERGRGDRPVLLRVDPEKPFGEVVQAVDACRAAGAKVFLAASKL